MFKIFKNNQGFTILELTIAVGVMLAIFSAIGGFMNRVIPDFMIISILNEESQYARSITQLLAREIKKSNPGLPKDFFFLRKNKKTMLDKGSDKGSVILPVMILNDSDNNTAQTTGKRIWIASEKDPIVKAGSSGSDGKNVTWVRQTIEQAGKIYSVNREGLLVYQTAKRTVDYELKIKDDEIAIFPNKGSNFLVVDSKYTVALPGTKNQLSTLNFTRNKPTAAKGDSIGDVFDEVYTIELAMNTGKTHDREFKFATTMEASVSPMTVRARMASGVPLIGG